MTSILKPWVQQLGLRHQGCLISAVRGCDGVPKNDAGKGLIRALRAEILVPHCGDAAKAASYIEKVSPTELLGRMQQFAADFDHYPVHFVLHLMHAAEIIGYCAMTPVATPWRKFYETMCRKMHVNPETCEQMIARLDADEDTFRAAAEIEANTPITAGGAAGSGGFDGSGFYDGHKPDFQAKMRAEAFERTGVEPPAGTHYAEPISDARARAIAEAAHRRTEPNFAKPGDRPESIGLPPNTDDMTSASRATVTNELLPEAFRKGYFDNVTFSVNRRSNHYDERDSNDFSFWELGWDAAHAAQSLNVVTDDGYPDPYREGYAAYGVHPVTRNPYQGIAGGSSAWTNGWRQASNDEIAKTKRLDADAARAGRGVTNQFGDRISSYDASGAMRPGLRVRRR